MTDWFRLRHWRFTSPFGSRISIHSQKSPCSMLRFTDAAPLRTLPCEVASIVESYILQKGTTPSVVPLLLDIGDPAGRSILRPIPTPPPCLASSIVSRFFIPMSWMLSPMSTPKQEIGSPRSVPILASTGVARPSQLFHMYP